MLSAWLTTSGLITALPGKISQVTLVAGTGGAATVVVYDGVGTSGEVIVALSAVTSDTKTVRLGEGRVVQTGLYASLGANVTGVLILWVPG